MLGLGNAMYISNAARSASPWAHISHWIRDRESYSSSNSWHNVTGQRGNNDNATAARASFAAISLLCMLLMAALLGNRIQSRYDRRYWASMTAVRVLPYLLYFFGIGFDLASGVTVANLGLHQTNDQGCKSAMYVCLVFYCGAKIVVQAFLIERAHAVRHKLKKRLNDWIWITFMVVTVLGFATIVTLALRSPNGSVDPNDHQCRIGLPRVAVMVLMTWDILINISLTCTFLILLLPLLLRPKATRSAHPLKQIDPQTPLRPILRKHDSSSKLTGLVAVRTREGDAVLDMTASQSSTLPPTVDRSTEGDTVLDTTASQLSILPPTVDRSTDHLKGLVYKTIGGTMVMMAATIINLVVLYKYHGFEHGWMCFTCCLVDITWTVGIIHLLTETKKEASGPLLARQAYSDERLQAATNERLQAALYRPSLGRNVISEGRDSLTTISSL
ncbi:hypothetical protein Tdes44962_MAKER02463 [Teratosphaeria destructans]|uniref:Uncharacterized protein n=1 Tax=Teratosphaeria destructans TaxID=418781 RepID=A0A9W7STZ3_9PEZI|nr:hypothetical protein Tdes44962_MAKER02463 [Teratosphaeria destructans]